MVRGTPTGTYARRSWFLYEWLLGKTLDLPAAEKGTYVQVVDPDLQWTAAAVTSTRHHVKSNLPGTPSFCPMIFRTETLREFTKRNLPAREREVVADLPADVLARAAAFLLLKDTRSSIEIEGEHPPQERIQRLGRAIGEAGRKPLDLDEVLRLQRVVIGDDRFVLLGLRNERGFVGDRDSGAPLPDHISTRHKDLPSLIEGLVAFDRKAAPDLDAVLAAAVLAFGFIYIHPFADGNGRLHRYLIHHILEFLYECVARTIDVDLPAEARYLQAYDTFSRSVTEIVDMPDGTVDLLFRSLRQNTGVLSKRGREKEFAKLTDDEIAKVEASYRNAFRE